MLRGVLRILCMFFILRERLGISSVVFFFLAQTQIYQQNRDNRYHFENFFFLLFPLSIFFLFSSSLFLFHSSFILIQMQFLSNDKMLSIVTPGFLLQLNK